MRDMHTTVSEAVLAAERLFDYRDERKSAPKKTIFSWNGGNRSEHRDIGSSMTMTSVVSNKFRQGSDPAQREDQTSSNSGGKSEASTTRKSLNCFFCAGLNRMVKCHHKGDFDATRIKLAALTRESEVEPPTEVEKADEHAFYQSKMHYVSSLRRLGSMVKISDSEKEKSSGQLYVDMMVNGRQTRALIDTGATHNYVALGEARRLGMVLRSRIRLCDKVCQFIRQVHMRDDWGHLGATRELEWTT
ncbi:hypothetical protein RND81_05G020200 [Saponaria officinalis]|uniref:Uncharacterized protein n=1 Tax=Saponaria officinalis TaxID=3572 RepID=A0AAW1KPX2_SAPOF